MFLAERPGTDTVGWVVLSTVVCAGPGPGTDVVEEEWDRLADISWVLWKA